LPAAYNTPEWQIVLHTFDGKTPFSEATLTRIAKLKEVYDLDLDASASHSRC
jgi:hypothetical protein